MREADPDAGLDAAQQAAADAGHKALMPIGAGPARRSFLDYVLAELADAGLTDVCLVVGPAPDAVRDYYEQHPPPRLGIAFAEQPVADGTARAVLAARAFAGDDAFLVLNGDNVYPSRVVRQLVTARGPAVAGFEREALVSASGFSADRVAAFALLEVDQRAQLKDIVEKPGRERLAAAGPRALVSMNLWRLDARIFDACRDVGVSPRGEHELPDAVRLSLSRGVEYTVVRAEGGVVDLSRRGDVAEATRRLADRGVPR
jgi:glucose-1-phosphate thymidylyltransferase